MTLTELKAYRAKLYEALLDAPEAESYTIQTGGSSRSVKTFTLEQLEQAIARIDRQIARKEGRRGIKTRYFTPHN